MSEIPGPLLPLLGGLRTVLVIGAIVAVIVVVVWLVS